MSYLDFKINASYARHEIIDVAGAPTSSKRGGAWFTGYHTFEGNSFIFATVGASGRTGHYYDNQLLGDTLIWQGRTSSRLSHPSVSRMLDTGSTVYIFVRYSDRELFTFKGLGKAVGVMDLTPVRVVWSLFDPSPRRYLPEEVVSKGGFPEGSVKKIYVNSYERNELARRACLEHYGSRCSVCDLDFGEVYGNLGAGFTHVHHLIPLSEVGPGYEVDPIADLRPVCPNCHAMLHRKNPPLSIDTLRMRLEARRKAKRRKGE